MSSEFSKHMKDQYAIYEAAGDSVVSATDKAYDDAMSHVSANIGTLVPGYDQNQISTWVSECYYEQFYDRMFFDLGQSPLLADQNASKMAAAYTSICSNIVQL